jgi:hypothetical protein
MWYGFKIVRGDEIKRLEKGLKTEQQIGCLELTSLLIQAVSSPDSANPTAARRPAPPAPTTMALL